MVFFTQPIDIPPNHEVTIEVPREVPAGRFTLTVTPEGNPPTASSKDMLKQSIPETMLLSERSLAKEWDMPEEDEAWANL